jgi:putative hydrolase of the HAD superfamily
VQPFFTGPFNNATLGKADLKEIIEPYLKGWGWPDTAEDLLNYWFKEESYYDTELMDYIQHLRQQGTPCYLATNQEKYRIKYIREVMGFQDKFDGMFVSCELGSQKPDIAFFEKMYSKLKPTDKSEIIFWDDLIENVGQASAFGYQAEHYTDFESFKEKMKQYAGSVS